MIRNFLMNWQYGIKARVVDGALVAKIATSVEPVVLRIELSQIANAVLAIQGSGNDYTLQFALPRSENLPVAKFETRDAAETARRYIACALYKGSRKGYFRMAFGAGLGLMAAAVVGVLVFTSISTALGTGRQTMAGAGMAGLPAAAHSAGIEMPSIAPAAPAAPAEQGMPMSADDFLKQ